MKICFVAHNIYPLFCNKNTVEKIGGAELQQMFIGKGLQDRGYEVSYISHDYGQQDGETFDNLIFYKSFQPDEGIFGIRFFYPRLFKIWKALIKADADVYYARCASFLPGILAIFCKIYGKKFIYASACDADFIPKQVLLRLTRDRLIYKYGFQRSHAVIVQSDVQKKLLWESYKLKGKVIRNINPGKGILLPDSERRYILWVSNLIFYKRPLQFLKLAEMFPKEEFVMIGGANEFDRNLYDKVKRKSHELKNLTFMGFQPFNKTEEYFDRCKVFINTSEYEGFPNTFLQAWRRGVPVISYVDPDNVIKKNQLGLVASSEQELHKALASFLANPSWDSVHILQYFEKNHSSAIIDQYCEVLEQLRES